MRCPKCDKQNPADARFCNACGCALTDNRPDVRVSRAAIASLLCALCALACFLPGLVAALDPRLLNPKSHVVDLVAGVSVLMGATAVLLGLIALSLIASSGGRLTGSAFAAIGAVIPPIVIFVLSGFNIGGRWRRTVHPRMVCGTNLSRLGKAILMYSNDYDGRLPLAGGPNGRWVARLPWWVADNRKDAYGLSDPTATEGRASVSASLYLLVKYAEVTPKSFICKEDYGTTEFEPARYGVGDRELVDLWDFGPNPPRHCSYAYHMSYGPYALTTSSELGTVVAADRNPWIASAFAKAKKDFSKFDPAGDREAIRAGNALAHQEDGQNVLFLDTHVSFEKRAYCGIDDDNIYTSWNGEDRIGGTPPALGSQPADARDSLLVNDPAIPR